MTNSADLDQLVFSWSGSTLFAKTGHVVFSKRKVNELHVQSFYDGSIDLRHYSSCSTNTGYIPIHWLMYRVSLFIEFRSRHLKCESKKQHAIEGMDTPVIFPPFLQERQRLWLPVCTVVNWYPLEKGPTLKGKNLLLGSKFFPIRVDP